jgi:D-alanyl-lipoteichoic acid acyltransferase DltB (MBOAT superfamily)
MSYTIDVYRRQITPTRSFARFFLYVSFFPQLVAGPIERAAHLLTQFEEAVHRRFSAVNLAVGGRMILWGMFKKIMIADYCGLIVDAYYSDPTAYNGATAWVATYAFYIQIYCDFSAYSEIARGSARLFGIDLMKNFDQPLLSTSIADFWRRWHISLSTWFRDYVYIPLGGNRRRLHRVMFNLFITAAISGLWHGAAWNFVLWGCYHGVLLVLTSLVLRTRWYAALAARLGKTEQFLGFLLQFHLSVIGFFIFCSGSLSEMAHTLNAAGRALLAGMPLTSGQGVFVGFVVLFLALSWVCRRYPVFRTINENTSLSVLFYGMLIVIMLLYGNMDEQPFFYFQF